MICHINLAKTFAVLLVMCLLENFKTTDAHVDLVPGTMEATIDGTSWKANSGTATKTSGGNNQVTGSAVIVSAAKILDATNGANETLSFTIFKDGNTEVTEGTYQMGVNSGNYTQMSFATFDGVSEVTSFVSTEGTLTITSYTNDGLKGEFNGTVTNLQSDETKTLTKGSFNVEFGFIF